MDSVPGASCLMTLPGTTEPQQALLFGSSIWKKALPISDRKVEILGTLPGIINEEGLIISGSDGVLVKVERVKINGWFWLNVFFLSWQTNFVL